MSNALRKYWNTCRLVWRTGRLVRRLDLGTEEKFDEQHQRYSEFLVKLNLNADERKLATAYLYLQPEFQPVYKIHKIESVEIDLDNVQALLPRLLFELIEGISGDISEGVHSFSVNQQSGHAYFDDELVV